MNINKYNILLPIGSVVKLKGAIKPCMISTYLVENQNNKIKKYAAVPYPEGLMSIDNLILFDDEMIGEIIFTGYNSTIFKNYEKEIKKEIEKY